MKTERLEQYPVPVHRTVLKNGLTIVTANTGSCSVKTEICFRTGSCFDGDYPGTAHFLEHVMHRGDSASGTNKRISPLIDLGASTNAGTANFFTGYYLESLSEHLNQMLEALVLETFHDDLSDSFVDNERQAILQEITDHKISDEFNEAIQKILHPNSPEAHAPVLGYRDTVSRIDVDILRSFRQKHYQAGNAVILVAGGTDHACVLDLSKKLGVESLQTLGQNKKPVIHLSAGRGVITDNRQKETVSFFFTGPEEDSDDELIFQIIRTILTSGLSSLLQYRLRIQDGLIYGANTILTQHFAPMIEIEIGASPKNFEEIEKAVWEELAKLKEGEFTDQLFLTAKALFFRRTKETEEDQKEKSSFADWCRILRSEWLRQEWTYRTDEAEFIKSVTKNDIMRVAKKYLDQTTCHTLFVQHDS